MLIIEPKYSLNSAGWFRMFVTPPADENTPGSRLASVTFACHSSA